MFFTPGKKSPCFFSPQQTCDYFDDKSIYATYEFFGRTESGVVLVLLPNNPTQSNYIDRVYQSISKAWNNLSVQFECVRISPEDFTSLRPCTTCGLIRRAEVVIIDVTHMGNNHRMPEFFEMIKVSVGIRQQMSLVPNVIPSNENLMQNRLIMINSGNNNAIPAAHRSIFDYIEFSGDDGQPDFELLYQKISEVAQDYDIVFFPLEAEDSEVRILEQSNSDISEVHFSLFSPSQTEIDKRYGLYVYAHLEKVIIDVQRDVEKYVAELGGKIPSPKSSKRTVELEQGTSITVFPECDEIDFEPKSITKKWQGDWTRFEFEFRPTKHHINDTLFVRVSIQVAGIEIAHIKCSIEVNEAKDSQLQQDPLPVVSNPLAVAKMNRRVSTPYQRIFISYSRQDSNIAKSYKIAQTALGNDAFLDVDNLRAGEDWRAALANAIEEADIFQLFWSEHSAASEYCRYEWDYALNVRCSDDSCEGFIRPVYWRKPMPSPPPALSRINFRFVPFEDQDD